MLILLSAALFGFGLLLFGLGLAVWLLGVAVQIALLLLQLVLWLIWAGITFAGWLRQQKQRADLLKIDVELGPSGGMPHGQVPALRGNIRTKHGSRRVPYLTIVE